jgi:Cu(I)/Ag(I) efflux system membrane fusion protein
MKTITFISVAVSILGFSNLDAQMMHNCMMKESDQSTNMMHQDMTGDSSQMEHSMMMNDSSMMEGMKHGMMGNSDMKGSSMMMRMMKMMMCMPMMDMMMNHSNTMEGMEHGAMNAETTDDHSAHHDLEMDTKEINTNDEFREQLQKAYYSYIEMKDAFVASDVEIVKNKAEKLKSELDEVDRGLLKGNTQMVWMEQIQKLNAAVLSIIDAENIEAQRSPFAEFNSHFFLTIKTFGIHHGTVYYQYCPMAFGGKGAFWLSNIKDIQNPYFGEVMLHCGETRETLDFS